MRRDTPGITTRLRQTNVKVVVVKVIPAHAFIFGLVGEQAPVWLTDIAAEPSRIAELLHGIFEQRPCPTTS